MTLQYYVAPEQMMQDKAEYARKGIAKGKSIAAIEYEDGILLTAENPSRSLNKISEIYDRIAFAGAGKYSEFENLRKAGIRYADLKGYMYSREDVTTKSLANAYSETIGNIFTKEPKPLEVEILLAELGMEASTSVIYRILYDGSITDHRHYAVIGGQTERIESYLKGDYADAMKLADALATCVAGLKSVENKPLNGSDLEVAIMDRQRPGRKFARLRSDEVDLLLSRANVQG